METAFLSRLHQSRWMSLLARETNWMETWGMSSPSFLVSMSLLARETNWMETWCGTYCLPQTPSPYSLGKLIEWKPWESLFFVSFSESLLARETNWMETRRLCLFARWLDCPYSLGKLIEWKLHRFIVFCCPTWFSPYSLGKLIEWKPFVIQDEKTEFILVKCPYSLGKLIEWKQLAKTDRFS